MIENTRAPVAVRESHETYRAGRGHPAAGPSAPAGSPRLTEADLSTLWAGQRFPASALVTDDGAPVRVLHPGRRGRGAGPDFRDAIIALPAGPALRGDVELHVRASDFHAHGHARDAAYNRVVVHVVFEDDTGGATRLASGRTVAVVALAPWLHRRAQELQDWLSSPRLWREPCHDAVARHGADQVGTLLDAWGDQRFEARVQALTRDLTLRPAGDILLRALLEGLGYGGNGALLAHLTARLSWDEMKEALAAARPDARIVEHILLVAAGTALDGHTGRPANHPAKRLAGLARLVARHAALFADTPDPRGLLGLPSRGLVAAFTVAPLIGRSRAVELLTNAVLPWAAAVRPDSASLASERYAQLPRPASYGALAFLEQNLSLEGKAIPLSARRQQGLLALYKSECTQGGCGRCALS